MMRGLRYALIGLLAIVLLVVALANRGAVTLRLLPEEAGQFLGLGWSLQLPLFLVILAAVLLGLLLGYVFEWGRAARHRRSARRQQKEAAALKTEMTDLRRETRRPKDEVLAILETPRAHTAIEARH